MIRQSFCPLLNPCFPGMGLLLLTCVAAEGAPLLCWTTANGINTAQRDGTHVGTLINGPSGDRFAEIQVNTANEQIYWFEYRSIKRAGYDGSNPQAVITDNNMYTTAGDFALDRANGRVYWANQLGELRRANLDGSSPQTLRTGLLSSGALEVDPVNRKLFWLEYEGNGSAIYMGDLNGGGRTYLAYVEPTWKVTDLAVDTQTARLYWSETAMSVNERVRRLSYAPGTPTVLINAELGYLSNVTLDLDLGKMLLVDRSGGRILEAGLDGSGLTTLITGETRPSHLTILPVPEASSLTLLAVGTLTAFRRRAPRRR